MPKASRGLTFALKAAQPFRVAAHLRRQHFNCHAIAQQDVARAIHCAHAASPEQCFNLILTVENAADERLWIFLQHFAVFGTEAYVVVVLAITGGTKLHAETITRLEAGYCPPACCASVYLTIFGVNVPLKMKGGQRPPLNHRLANETLLSINPFRV